MNSRNSRPAKRPVLVASCLMALAFAIAIVAAADAQAAYYKLVLCAANNGSNGYQVRTNTASAQNPSGIFSVENYCGPAGDPAGDSAFLRIYENQPSGSAGDTAYASASWGTVPWVGIAAAGGYTREPGSFNDGWRARFWAEGYDGSTNNILMQGSGVANGSLGGVGWGTTSTFGSHLWPFTGFADYRRFFFELTCMRPAGCDRSGWNGVDANSIVLLLNDAAPVDLHLTGTGSAPLNGQWVRGAQTATYVWSDQGSGIRLEWIDIDGARNFTIDHASECNIGYSQVNGEFARDFQACAVAAGIGRGDTFDTAAFPDGAHTLRACAQDYGQYIGLYGSGGASCDQTTIHTDNTAPGAPVGLEVTSANPARYLPRVGARWGLPSNSGSPIVKVHYEEIDAAGKVVVPEQTVSALNPTELPAIDGPVQAGAYRLRVWLEDQVGFTGPPALAPIPHDTTPPSAPQGLSVTTPQTSRALDGFDVHWRNLTDAGSPIDAVHYQVLDASGKVVVGTHDLPGDNPQAIPNLDTPQAQGKGTLRLWLSDAEGNVGAPVTAPLSYDCVRSEVGGGTNLSASFGTGDGSALVNEGQGATLSGTVQGANAGASICVFSRVTTDQERQFLGVAMTGTGGEYRFAVPAGPSREVIAAYRPGQRELSASATVETIVHPTFALRRKVIHNKGFGIFTGSIPGPHNGNVIVVLQVRDGKKKWRAFRRYRTREDGQFTLRYRFTHTQKPTTFVTRAQVREQSGYPYEAGDSDPLGLRVLP